MAKQHEHSSPATVQIVFCACPDAATADLIAQRLVTDGLAACINQLPGLTSTYRWQGKLCREEEILLMIKTSSSHLDDIEARIQSLHPYELPEVLAVPCSGGSQAYLAWVLQAVAGTH